MSKKLPTGFRQRERGGLEYRFRVDGKRYSVYGATVKECRDKEITMREEIAKGLYTSNRDITVSAYFEEYLAGKSGSVKEATLIHNRSTFNRINKEFGKKKIRTIESRQINAFRAKLEKEINDDGSKLTTHGGNDILELLQAVLESAVNDGIIARNPSAGVKRFKRVEEQAKDTIHRKLSDDELDSFFVEAKDSFYLLLFHFMLLTGMRVGECLALYWTDIDYNADVINVSRSVTKVKNSKGITVIDIGDSAKTAAGKRAIPMNAEIHNVLQEQKKRIEMCFGSKVTGLVFPSTKNEVARPSSIDTVMKGFAKTAGVEHFSAHAFRHTFASKMVDAGVAPEVLKNILGHTNIRVTIDTYYHSNGDRMREAMGNVVSLRKVV